MQVSAIAKRLQISPQKVRLVADQVRGKPVADALDILNFSTKKGAVLVKKTVESCHDNRKGLLHDQHPNQNADSGQNHSNQNHE